MQNLLKPFVNIMKKFKNLNKKTLIIGFIVITICIIFVVSNILEYNLNNVFNFSTNNKINNIDNFNNIYEKMDNYSIKFKNNDEITSPNDNVYYNYLDEDLELESLEVTLTTTSDMYNYYNNKSNIKSIYIMENNTLKKHTINKENYDFIPTTTAPTTTSTSTSTTTTTTTTSHVSTTVPTTENNINIYFTDTKLNLPKDYDNRTNILFGNIMCNLHILYNNDDELILSFNIGDKRFRYFNEVLKDDDNNELDKILLYTYDENTKQKSANNLQEYNSASDTTTTVDLSLQQFNKLVFQIEKPKLSNIRDKIVSAYVNNKNTDYIESIKEFDKFTPSKFIISIHKTTYTGSIDVTPKYEIPKNGALCLEGTDKFVMLNDNACKLTLTNIIPGETYELKIILKYTQLNNPNNARYSKLSTFNFNITNNVADKNNDILTSTVSNLKEYDFTDKMLSLLEVKNKFNKSQELQNNKLLSLETTLQNNLQSYNM